MVTHHALFPLLVADEHGALSRSVPLSFQRELAFGGVYGLVDPRDWRIAYVGRSVDVGKRFKQHIGQLPARGLSLAAVKNQWVVGLLGAGCAPGVLVLSNDNQAWIESRWIFELRKRGQAWLNAAD